MVMVWTHLPEATPAETNNYTTIFDYPFLFFKKLGAHFIRFSGVVKREFFLGGIFSFNRVHFED